MKKILTKVKKENFKDLKKIGEYNKKENQDIENIKLEETNLYKYLNKLNNEKLNQIICYMLTGRELSRYYGTTLKIGLNEYLEYFKANPAIQSNDKQEKIKYICYKSKKLNNYIDTVLGRL